MRNKDSEVMSKIIEYIDDVYISANRTPTMQEIADIVGMTKGTISKYIKEMTEKGMVENNGGWYGIRTKKISKILDELCRVPIVGEIACGTPMLAEENIESYLTISSSFLGQGTYFALKAHGNSMINANIKDGDFVIVRKQNTAEEGEIIVALIDDSATLKRFFKDEKKRKIRLHPENDEMQDMYFDKVEIQGVVKKIVKDCI